ncbi:hypothetical protein [Kushneria avicenniae]|uniref:hypothetical protein n=1 Tax=Kushneria avicenniae TaxID=402385 RepID=UPI001587F17F|nr:hypothetical protein [Kushneria avicenniae]
MTAIASPATVTALTTSATISPSTAGAAVTTIAPVTPVAAVPSIFPGNARATVTAPWAFCRAVLPVFSRRTIQLMTICSTIIREYRPGRCRQYQGTGQQQCFCDAHKGSFGV